MKQRNMRHAGISTLIAETLFLAPLVFSAEPAVPKWTRYEARFKALRRMPTRCRTLTSGWSRLALRRETYGLWLLGRRENLACAPDAR